MPDPRERPRQQGGIPDGLLLGILALLLMVTVLTWTATGLSGLFAHGSWPSDLSFMRTPLALRHLISHPDDLPGAWPDTPPAALSGYGLFWGLFIGQLMILLTLTFFGLGTWARWRVVRARKRGEREAARGREREEKGASEPYAATPDDPHLPPAAAAGSSAPTPAPTEPAPTPVPQPLTTPVPTLRAAPRDSRLHLAAQALQDAPGPAVVLTSNPALWHTTKDARAKLGPTLLYDPTHLCDTPSRLHWPPMTGCETKDTAIARATALLAPTRPTARIDQAVADTAHTLLRSYLHAAALDGRTIRHVHRWSQGTNVQEAVKTLRTHPKAAPGSAGELEAALTAHPDRRDIAQELTTRTLAALSTVNIREACTPNRTDALALDSFIAEGGTLYVVGDSIEDPRTNPGAMPLLTALVASVVERGRRMAERSSSGRLDPPLTLILDDVAAVAPFPTLPDLLATGTAEGLPTLALVRSEEQAKSRWPDSALPF
ncbi:type VI secretion protein [Streptomyces roseirectus]|uniref:Type VI secretion protein n=1 Tax=Streptomyces roseirectus TaxID=2768066 RepID=A0A7H0IGA6_9ACTN|nr:type IV secretory system conjugative DNA transfer family protein [Streptomyces roseirectus]QNP71822.1 type VI secretion protein [Streptomyces roseirectus]